MNLMKFIKLTPLEQVEKARRETYISLKKHEKRIIEKMNNEKKEIKKDLIINFSPSEFAFGFEGCKKCYYDKKINKSELKSFFPPIFNTFDRIQKRFFHGKSSKEVDKNLEEGTIVADYERIIRTKVLYDKKNRPFTMSGKIDAYIKHKDSFSVIDFKTTNINPNKIKTYETQLQSYAFMLENSDEKSLKLSPIKGLGILCFEPNNITNKTSDLVKMDWDTKWYSIDVIGDHKKIIDYVTTIQDFLFENENPQSSNNCNVCNFFNEKK